MKHHTLPRRHVAYGMSLLELLVGVALGLMLVSVALAAWGNQAHEAHRLAIETRLSQDLRAALELMSRNLRRAGHWSDAQAGVWRGAATVIEPNPHSAWTVSGSSFQISRSPRRPTDVHDGENDNVSDNGSDNGSDSDEADMPATSLAYRLRNGVIEMQLGESPWQALTDAHSMVVTHFEAQADVHAESMQAWCRTPCASEAAREGRCPPVQEVRRVTLQLEAKSATAPDMTRSIGTTVFLRNDALSGHCGDRP